MTVERLEGELEYLVAVADRLRKLHAEVARLNRRLRNARGAVHVVEEDLAELRDEIAARLDRLHRSGAEQPAD